MFGRKTQTRDHNVVLGEEYTDTISGFKGTAVYVIYSLTSATQVVLQPPVKDDGELPEAIALDETQLLDKRGRRVARMPTEALPPKEEKRVPVGARGGPAQRISRATTPRRG